MLNWLSIGAGQMALGVILGAFGAHGLNHVLLGEPLAWWHTATQYLFVHALGLIGIGLLAQHKSIHISIPLTMQLGILLFCGSLYAMALGAPKWLGMMTPLGGLCFIAAWLLLAARATYRFGA